MLLHIPPTVGSRSNTTSPTCNPNYNYSSDSSLSFSDDILDNSNCDISIFTGETENNKWVNDKIIMYETGAQCMTQ